MSKVPSNYTSPRTKAAGARQNEAVLKDKVRELEAEVSSLKRRLDELRKAKNTTVLKKEKEYVASKQQRRTSGDSTSVVDVKLVELKTKHEAEVKKMRAQHSNEMNQLVKKHEESLKSRENSHARCDHEPELRELRSSVQLLKEENAGLQSVNGDLRAENVDLRTKFEELFTELSLKEAQWCEKEEQLNLKLKLQWGEKYREWMEATEKKISDLQKANDLLRSYVRPPPDD